MTDQSQFLPVASLMPGEQLTRQEFEQRYEAAPVSTRAELIGGFVVMSSPASFAHSLSLGQITTWLGLYSFATPGVELHSSATVRLDEENELEPDALLRLTAETGGNTTVSADGYIEGAPELVVEVSTLSVYYDMHGKFDAYRRCGVQEYIVWQCEKNRLDWFYLKKNDYRSLDPDRHGVLHSRVLPGLALAAKALLKGNLAKVLQVAQESLESKEHESFLKKLQPKKG
jgi:Uma2 family endonuclease